MLTKQWGSRRVGGRKGSLPPARGTPVSPKWESGETDLTGWEESCLSACLSVFQVEAGGGTGREVEAASLVRISKFHSWATLIHTPNTDTRPGFRPMGRHLRFHRLHGDMRTQGHKCAGHSATHGAGIHAPTHIIIPANHSPMCPHTRLCSGDRKPARGLGLGGRSALSPQPGVRAPALWVCSKLEPLT